MIWRLKLQFYDLRLSVKILTLTFNILSSWYILLFFLLYSIVYILDRSLIDSSTLCAEQVLTCLNMILLLLVPSWQFSMCLYPYRRSDVSSCFSEYFASFQGFPFGLCSYLSVWFCCLNQSRKTIRHQVCLIIELEKKIIAN